MTAPSPLPDRALCPVCGRSNQCAMEVQKATGVEQQPCWCTGAAFSPELLDRVPDALRGAACICARCAQAAAQR